MRKSIDNALADVRNDLELIKTIVMIREPASVQAAEAYDGLRKAVIAGSAERTAHLQSLARLDAEVTRGADIAAIQKLLRDCLAEAGLHRVNEVEAGLESAFDTVGGKGDTLRVVEPAYFEDTGRGAARLVRTGKAERVDSDIDSVLPPAPPAAETEAPPKNPDRDDDALGEMATVNEGAAEAGR